MLPEEYCCLREYAHCRTPDWRFRLPNNRHTANFDQWCKRLVAFRRRNCESSADPDLAMARDIADGDPLGRAEIEARILANESVEQIAAQSHLSTTVIEAFEAIYFDVRHRLGELLWIRLVVLTISPMHVLPTADVGYLWRCYAHLYGPDVLNALLNGADRAHLRESGVDAYLEANSLLSDGLKAIIAADRDPSSQTTLETFRQLGRLLGTNPVTPRTAKTRRRCTQRS